MKKGILKARRNNQGRRRNIWLIVADDKELKRLQSLKDQPKQWIYHSRVKRVN